MKVILIIILALVCNIGYGQSIDARIGTAINSGKWQELRTLYFAEGDKLQSPLLHPLSKFFISHFYNQPDSALYYGTKLLKEHQSELGGSVGNIIYLLSNDFAKMGQFENASSILHQFNEAMKTAGMKPMPLFLAFENQNRVIAQRGGFSLVRPQHEVKVPLKYHDTRSNPGMLFVKSKINNVECDATYDTGAGVNMISQEFAKALGVNIHDFEGADIAGMHTGTSRFAVVDSLRLGDIVYRNIPFQVVDFRTGHDKADSVIKQLELHCVIGTQTMIPLGEIQLDFKNGSLIIPAKPTEKPHFAPNMYYSAENVLILSVYDNKTDEAINAMLDTGASITQLTSKYYNRNKSLFLDIVPRDSVRMAGIGGVKIGRTLSTQWEYRIGDSTSFTEPIVVNTDQNADVMSQYDCLFGLPSLTKHDLVIINFQNMWIDFCH